MKLMAFKDKVFWATLDNTVKILTALFERVGIV